MKGCPKSFKNLWILLYLIVISLGVIQSHLLEEEDDDIETKCDPYGVQSSLQEQRDIDEEFFFSEKKQRLTDKYTVQDKNPTPAIILPGYLGSVLDARISKHRKDFLWCNWYSHHLRLWLTFWFLEPFRSKTFENCWYKMMSLNYTEKDSKSHFDEPKGLKVKPVEYMGKGRYGGTKGCDYIVDVGGYGVVSYTYFGYLIEKMEDELGYVRGKTLFAAPYDWRYSPDFLEEKNFFNSLKNLIEKVSNENNNKSVVIIAHSMGNLLFLKMLNSQTQEWKDRYIKLFVSFSAPWIGAPKSLRSILSGDVIASNDWLNLGLEGFDREKVLKLGQDYGALPFLFPTWNSWANYPLVSFTDIGKNFTGKEIFSLLQETKRYKAAQIYQQVKNISANLEPPKVPTYCIAGKGIPTEKRYVYQSIEDIAKQGFPKTFCSKGDGTVNAKSLRVCQQWKEQNQNAGKPIEYHEYSKKSHTGILKDFQVVKDVIDLLRE